MNDTELRFKENLSKIGSFMALGKRRLVVQRSIHRRCSLKKVF